MAKKRQHEKENKTKEMTDKAVKIKCCYCNIKDNCKFRTNKEKSEAIGITTFCTLTPNSKNVKNSKI